MSNKTFTYGFFDNSRLGEINDERRDIWLPGNF